MAVRSIVQHPDARLRQSARPVERFDDDLRRLVGDLADTLRDSPGIGLSGVQIGDRRAVFVCDLSERRDAPEVYCNPEVVRASNPGLVEESCLSIPGIEGDVIRSTEVDVRAVDEFGTPFERHLSGMAAVCFQHELDHLNGVLFIDRLTLVHRLRVKAALWRRRIGAGDRVAAGS